MVGRTEHGIAKYQDIRCGPIDKTSVTTKLERTTIASFVSHASVDFQWRVWVGSEERTTRLPNVVRLLQNRPRPTRVLHTKRASWHSVWCTRPI